MDRQTIKQLTAEQVEIIQIIHDEVATTWVMDDPETMLVTLEIYRRII